MPAKQNIYGWDGSNWVKIKASATGALYIIETVDKLDDIGDVNVPAPTDQQGIEWDTATSKWILAYFIRHALLTTRGDIIFRNATEPARLAKGTAGQFLKQGANDPLWANAYLVDLLTTQGDIVTRNATAPKRLALGTEGHYLKAGASEPEWAAVVGGYTEGAKVYHNANQSIPDDTLTTLAFNSESYDTDTIHDNVTNNSRLTCKTAGKYAVSAMVNFAQNATGARCCFIRLNGGNRVAGFVLDATATAGYGTAFPCGVICNLSVNDFLEVQVKQTSGGNLDIVYTADWSPYFMMQRIG